jgi:hypothetical protein
MKVSFEFSASDREDFWSMKILNLPLVAWLVFTPFANAAGDQDPLLAEILSFAKASIGKPVGSGECTVLAAQALKAAGAMSRRRKEYPGPGDYIWGEEALLIEGAPGGPTLSGPIDDVKPGYIAQFRDAKFPHAHFSHHTAVVAYITPTQLGIIQQNYRGERFVSQSAFRIDKLSAGWIRFYRPLPGKTSG